MLVDPSIDRELSNVTGMLKFTRLVPQIAVSTLTKKVKLSKSEQLVLGVDKFFRAEPRTLSFPSKNFGWNTVASFNSHMPPLVAKSNVAGTAVPRS